MTYAQAHAEARKRGLELTHLFGWWMLFPANGGGFVARGQTWDAAFQILDAPKPAPPEQPGSLFSWREQE